MKQIFNSMHMLMLIGLVVCFHSSLWPQMVVPVEILRVKQPPENMERPKSEGQPSLSSGLSSHCSKKQAPKKDRTGREGTNVPTELKYWVKQIQRRIEKEFRVPAEVRKDETEQVVQISFLVDKKGDLSGEPTVTKSCSDSVLQQSCLNAILSAKPFPPLPEIWTLEEQQVVYTFTVRN